MSAPIEKTNNTTTCKPDTQPWKTYGKNKTSPSGNGTYAASSRTFGFNINSYTDSINNLVNSFNGLGGDSFSVGADGSCKPKPKNKTANNNYGSGSGEKNMLKGLIKIFLGALKLPTKFDSIFSGLESAGNSLAFGLEGIVKSMFLGLEDVILLCIAIFVFLSKYFVCFITFIINLPSCFITHVITAVSSVLYLIFPLTSYIFWSGTGVSLMPFYEVGFAQVGAFDDMFYILFGFNLFKLPPSIIKKCYTCNGKILKLKDVINDAMKISKVGDKISGDMTKTVPRYMKPAMPHLFKTAMAVDKVFS